MSGEPLACRVCLSTEVKLYDMHQYSLVAAYEMVTGTRISVADGLPNQTCSFCGTMLLKYAAFQERCIGAQGLLHETLMQHNSLTTSSIHTIDRITHHLGLPYSVSDVVNINAIDEKLDLRIKSDHDSEDEKPLSKINKKPHKKHRRKKSSKNVETDSFSVKIENDQFSDPIKDFNDDFEMDHNDDFDTNLNQLDDLDPTAEENLIKTEENDHEIPSLKSNKKSNKRTDEEMGNKLGSDLYEDFEVIILSKQEQIDEILARKESANYKNSFYKCDVCYKGFITEATFKNHLERHDPRSGAHACAVCGTRWAHARTLRAHRHAAHLRRYRCRRCGLVAKSSFKAREHRKWHEGVQYICKICGATFSKSTSHLTHLRLRHGGAQCTLCGAKVLGESGLRAHMRKAHRFQENQSPLHCATCDTRFLTPAALSTHATNPQCALYKWCVHCGTGFESGELLRAHVDTQHSDRKACHQCDKSFSSARTLAAHAARAHCDVSQPRAHTQRAVCELCGHTCTSKSTLIYHLRTHTGEKPYQCPECPKRFSVQQRLQIHIRTHTGERPFKCPFCPKAFKHKAALNRHHRVHTGSKPYQCTYCGKAFSQSNSMKSHVRTVHLKLPPPYRNRKKVDAS